MSVTVDTTGAMRRLDRAERALAAAAVDALNWTTADAIDEARNVMMRVFDRPTWYTLNSHRMRKAVRTHLESAIVIRDFGGRGTPAAKVLRPEIFGGPRGQKRYERALTAAGVLPSGMLTVAGSGAKLDAHGNISRGQIVQIMSWFKAHQGKRERMNMTSKRKDSLIRGGTKRRGIEYFVSTGKAGGGPGNHLPAGIYMRQTSGLGTSLRLIMIFVRRAQYQSLYDFEATVQAYVDRELPRKWDRAVRKHMASGGVDRR